MKNFVIFLVIPWFVTSASAQTHKLRAIRFVGASATQQMASVEIDTLRFNAAKNGSITISDSAGLTLFFTYSKAAELYDLTSSAIAELRHNIARNRLELGFKSGRVLARNGYSIEVGTPMQSDLGKMMMFRGFKFRRTDVGLFYSLSYADSALCVFMFVSEDIQALEAFFKKWKSKHYH